jgi:hypothetical protein
MLSRIIKDERRHFSFYFNQARLRLQPRAARVLTSLILRNFWTPVGSPVPGTLTRGASAAICWATSRGRAASPSTIR